MQGLWAGPGWCCRRNHGGAILGLGPLLGGFRGFILPRHARKEGEGQARQSQGAEGMARPDRHRASSPFGLPHLDVPSLPFGRFVARAKQVPPFWPLSGKPLGSLWKGSHRDATEEGFSWGGLVRLHTCTNSTDLCSHRGGGSIGTPPHLLSLATESPVRMARRFLDQQLRCEEDPRGFSSYYEKRPWKWGAIMAPGPPPRFLLGPQRLSGAGWL